MKGFLPGATPNGLLLNWRSGGADLGVFFRSVRSFWFPSPGSGPREVGRVPHLPR